MNKNEVREILKFEFYKRGFEYSKQHFYKTIDDDYLICFHITHSSYGKSYYFSCGPIYLPDKSKIPLRGLFDITWEFQFPKHDERILDLTCYPNRRKLTHNFEYEKYTPEKFKEFFEINYLYFMLPLEDKEFGLEYYRDENKWSLLDRFSDENIEKICRKANIDIEKVFKHLGKQTPTR